MKWHKENIQVRTRGKGLYSFTQEVAALLRDWGVQEGMCFLYIQHTSASLVVSESYDPSARIDLESFMERVAPENQPWHRHRLEGADDSPAHIRAMLTDASLSIPVDEGQLSLGTWQGLYLFEHRDRPHTRQVLLRCMQVI